MIVHQLIFTQDDNNPLVEPANTKGNIANGIGVFFRLSITRKNIQISFIKRSNLGLICSFENSYL